MPSAHISLAAAGRSLIVSLVLLLVGIVLAGILGGLPFLGLVNWTVLLVGLVVGLFLIVRGNRPIAGAGAIALAASTWIAFYLMPPAWIWTALFFVGAALIAYGSKDDTPDLNAWPVLLPRVAVGWALVDNAQDHFINRWLPAAQGTGFFQIATGAANRPPAHILDQLYQPFLAGVVVPSMDQWASLTIAGELSFGLMLAAGFLTPIGAFGAMWLNGNYMLMKSFTSHGGYPDKVFFAVELFCLIVLAGLAYGLDASLRRLVPAQVAQWLLGAPSPAEETTPVQRPEPSPA